MKYGNVVIAATLFSATACNKEATQLVVLVNSSLAVPANLSELRVEIVDNGTTIRSASFALSANPQSARMGEFPLPITFGIVAEDKDDVTLEIYGRSNDRDVVIRRAVTGFIKNKTLLLPMFLAKECVNKQCPVGQTCSEGGACIDEHRDPKSLEEVTREQVERNDLPGIDPFDPNNNNNQQNNMTGDGGLPGDSGLADGGVNTRDAGTCQVPNPIPTCGQGDHYDPNFCACVPDCDSKALHCAERNQAVDFTACACMDCAADHRVVGDFCEPLDGRYCTGDSDCPAPGQRCMNNSTSVLCNGTEQCSCRTECANANDTCPSVANGVCVAIETYAQCRTGPCVCMGRCNPYADTPECPDGSACHYSVEMIANGAPFGFCMPKKGVDGFGARCTLTLQNGGGTTGSTLIDSCEYGTFCWRPHADGRPYAEGACTRPCSIGSPVCSNYNSTTICQTIDPRNGFGMPGNHGACSEFFTGTAYPNQLSYCPVGQESICTGNNATGSDPGACSNYSRRCTKSCRDLDWCPSGSCLVMGPGRAECGLACSSDAECDPVMTGTNCHATNDRNPGFCGPRCVSPSDCDNALCNTQTGHCF